MLVARSAASIAAFKKSRQHRPLRLLDPVIQQFVGKIRDALS
jgi:hypothetical protein